MGDWFMCSCDLLAPCNNLHEARSTRSKRQIAIRFSLGFIFLISPAERSLYVLGWWPRKSIVNTMVHAHSVWYQSCILLIPDTNQALYLQLDFSYFSQESGKYMS